MLVSIIIPTHNRAQLLSELLASIREQLHRPVEVLVVDDASTDHTQDVVDRFKKDVGSDAGIVVTGSIMPKNGAQAARNEGIRLAQGEALMFVDSDDIFAPHGLAGLVCVLEQQPALAYAFGKVAITGATIDLDPTAWRGVVGERFDGSSAGLAGYHWHTMGALYRRECLERVGKWNVDLTGSQDWEFQARVKAFGGSGSFVPVIVGYWRQHSKSRVGTSTFRPDYIENVMRACASIISHARKAGMCDKTLQYRIARRLLVHAVAFGGEGYTNMKKACLAQAAETAPDATRLQFLVSALKRTPKSVDLLADLALRKIQNRP